LLNGYRSLIVDRDEPPQRSGGISAWPTFQTACFWRAAKHKSQQLNSTN
jgi:hypothetical protein